MAEKNFMIIGGTSGIGLRIVEKLVRSGNRVWVGSRQKSEELESMDGVRHFVTDVEKEVSLPEDLPDTIDGLAYCPGSIQLKPFGRLSEDDYLSDYRINFLGAVKVIQKLLPNLKKSEKSSSIVLFSTVAVQTGMPFHASIASAKGAIEAFARSLAAEYAPKIRVNVIAPSLTDTPMAGHLLSTDNKKKAANDRHPLKRFGQPEDIAEAAAFLLSDESSWMTGQILHVDGGISSLRLF